MTRLKVAELTSGIGALVLGLKKNRSQDDTAQSGLQPDPRGGRPATSR